jgi:hypothetical protein
MKMRYLTVQRGVFGVLAVVLLTGTSCDPQTIPAPEPPVVEPPPSVEKVRQMLNGIHFKDEEQRPLMELGESAFPAFEVILRDPNSKTQHVSRAMLILSKMKTNRQRFLQPAVERLGDTSGRVRCRAVQLLGEIGSEREAFRIVPLLTDPDITVSSAAVVTLAAIGGEREVATLGTWLNSPHRYLLDDSYQRRVIESLQSLQARLGKAKP